jgi:hypothetical protein
MELLKIRGSRKAHKIIPKNNNQTFFSATEKMMNQPSTPVTYTRCSQNPPVAPSRKRPLEVSDPQPVLLQQEATTPTTAPRNLLSSFNSVATFTETDMMAEELVVEEVRT